jgi:AraC family transcriptional regulator of adaptative response / DNA-3-methyladenine glycosylase II
VSRHGTRQDLCYRAVVTRDRRFDGRFFTAVLTTGVYCRPVCPARCPARKNVRFYACAAAPRATASAVPALPARDRTGLGAWLGTSATVTRALRLIEDGVLDRDGVEGLAERLGVTDRWLRQLFEEQLGASPLAVARTRRIHFARRLLDESTLPIEEVAAASGFGSARRLRDAIQATFHRSPAALRGRRSRVRVAAMENDHATTGGPALRLAARAPFDAAPILRFLSARAIPGIEKVEAGRYLRSAMLDGEPGIVEVTPVAGVSAVDVRWSGSSSRGLLELATRVARVFDLRADVLTIGAELTRDPRLARCWPHTGLRVPGAWDPFEIAVRVLLGQQVSVAAARTLAARLAERCGASITRPTVPGLVRRFPDATRLADANLDGLGITGARITAIRGLARAVAENRVDLGTARDLDDTVATLTQLPGVGPWTAQVIAMRALGEPDAFPAGDLGFARRSHTTAACRASARRSRSPNAGARGAPTQCSRSGTDRCAAGHSLTETLTEDPHMKIDFATIPTLVGPVVLFAHDDALIGLEFADHPDRARSLRARIERYLGPFETREVRDPAGAASQLASYFTGNRHASTARRWSCTAPSSSARSGSSCAGFPPARPSPTRARDAGRLAEGLARGGSGEWPQPGRAVRALPPGDRRRRHARRIRRRSRSQAPPARARGSTRARTSLTGASLDVERIPHHPAGGGDVPSPDGARRRALAARGIRRTIADEKPGFPCRVSLADAEPGERVLLLPLPTTTWTRRIAAAARSTCARRRSRQPRVNEVPAMLLGRLLSVRAYDHAR